MVRLLFAFILALFLHGFCCLLPVVHNQAMLPIQSGDHSIRVSLATTAQAQDQTPSNAQATIEENTPAVEEQVAVPPPLVVPLSQEETVTEPPEPESKAKPVTIVPASRKKKIKIKPLPTQVKPSPAQREKVQPTTVTFTSAPSETATATVAALVEAKPLYQSNPKPQYPDIACRRGWEGTVMLAVLVQINGTVREVVLHTSSGYALLDKAAITTVKKWQFIPGQKNNKAMEMEVLVPVTFSLSEK